MDSKPNTGEDNVAQQQPLAKEEEAKVEEPQVSDTNSGNGGPTS